MPPHERDVVCGTGASSDAADVGTPLTLHDFAVPYKPTFSPHEVADYFGVDARTIYREIEGGLLRALRVRGSLRIPMTELEAYVARQQKV